MWSVEAKVQAKTLSNDTKRYQTKLQSIKATSNVTYPDRDLCQILNNETEAQICIQYNEAGIQTKIENNETEIQMKIEKWEDQDTDQNSE